MAYYISSVLGYYEGDRQDVADVECPRRPSPVYDLENGEWVVDVELQAQLIATDDYNGLIRRRAKELEHAGKGYESLMLLKSIGE